MSKAGNSNGASLHLKKVAIVGSGPAGLTLARLLQMHGVDVTVYERDPSAEARNQGGSLDLHEYSGQLALQRAGLEDQFRALARPEGQGFTVLNQRGEVQISINPEQTKMKRPEIDRTALRDLLLGSLKPSTVVWNRPLEQVIPEPAGEQEHYYRLVFKDDSEVTADLVIGCDGAWSKVRPPLSPLKPRYYGVTLIDTNISNPDEKISTLVGEGSLFALGDNKALMAQRNGNGQIRVYVAQRVPENWVKTCGIDFAQPLQARQNLIQLFASWSANILALLRDCDDAFIPRPLHGFPPNQMWESKPGVTLLGDAAHVMPPFTGRGANMAMLDAVELADCLLAGQTTNMSDAIHTYERNMLARMSVAIRETLIAQDTMLSSDAPASWVEFIKEKIEAAGKAT